MKTITVKAPAKLNLYLNVLNKRSDGFHNIETIFEKIDLCDKIRLTRRKQGIRVFCEHKGVPEDGRNLGARAAQALLTKTRRSDGVSIRITKKIPVACGLGGGSSDAASVLVGLNRLLGCGLTGSQLMEIANGLGADVPFFLLKSPRAIGRGKGQALSPLRLKRKYWYVLVAPALEISTRRMYQHPRLALTRRPAGAKIVLRSLERGDLTSLNKYSYNSFEPILTKKYKQVVEIKKALNSSGVCATLMSGSGPCIFGITQTRKEAMNIAGKLQASSKPWQVIVTSTYSENSEKEYGRSKRIWTSQR